MSIPLVRNNTKDAINTSIIAIKKNLERINSILGLMDSSEPDLSGLATKQELEDAVTEINNTIDEVETSLQPVDTVASGNMHSVTSNAVASMFKLLWSNSSPSSDFSAQSISIPTMDDYSMLFVVLNWASYLQYAINQVLIIKGQTESQFFVTTCDANNIYEVARNVTISNNQLNIDDGLFWVNGSRSGIRNDICIPFRIYGMK